MRSRRMILGLIAIGLLVPACKEVEAAEDSTYQEASTLVAIDGADGRQVMLAAPEGQRSAWGAFDAALAALSDGPVPGPPVVTVGAAELFGVESGVGH